MHAEVSPGEETRCAQRPGPVRRAHSHESFSSHRIRPWNPSDGSWRRHFHEHPERAASEAAAPRPPVPHSPGSALRRRAMGWAHTGPNAQRERGEDTVRRCWWWTLD
jgi:hypothetical protein